MSLEFPLESLSFSDDANKVPVELYSAPSSSTSENDNASSIHYVSKTDASGCTKLSKAQKKRRDQELIILCNKKIYYFLEKDARISSGKLFIQI